jgi:hypothetical protein
MKVWVIASDLGLNGIWVHGVRSTEPTATEMNEFAASERRLPDGLLYRVNGVTGYGGTDTLEVELDGEWQ